MCRTLLIRQLPRRLNRGRTGRASPSPEDSATAAVPHQWVGGDRHGGRAVGAGHMVVIGRPASADPNAHEPAAAPMLPRLGIGHRSFPADGLSVAQFGRSNHCASPPLQMAAQPAVTTDGLGS